MLYNIYYNWTFKTTNHPSCKTTHHDFVFVFMKLFCLFFWGEGIFGWFSLTYNSEIISNLITNGKNTNNFQIHLFYFTFCQICISVPSLSLLFLSHIYFSLQVQIHLIFFNHLRMGCIYHAPLSLINSMCIF